MTLARNSLLSSLPNCSVVPAEFGHHSCETRLDGVRLLFSAVVLVVVGLKVPAVVAVIAAVSLSLSGVSLLLNFFFGFFRLNLWLWTSEGYGRLGVWLGCVLDWLVARNAVGLNSWFGV